MSFNRHCRSARPSSSPYSRAFFGHNCPGLRVGFAWLIAALLCTGTGHAADDIRVADEQLFARLDTNGDGQIAGSEVASSHSRLFARLLRLGDADNDGQLDQDEWQVATQPRRPAKPIEQKQSSELPGADAARLMLLKLDTNRDARLTEAETPSELLPLFERIVERYDRNEDGAVNSLELGRGGPQLMRMAERMVRELNIDVESELATLEREQGDSVNRFDVRPSRDQMLSNPSQTRAIFEQFDADGNGQLELSELPAELSEQQRQRLGRLLRRGDRNGDKMLSEKEFMDISARIGRFLNRKE